jgi:hypothetical protein
MSKKTQRVSTTKNIWLMIFRGIIIVSYRNQMKFMDAICMKNAELLKVKVHDT